MIPALLQALAIGGAVQQAPTMLDSLLDLTEHAGYDVTGRMGRQAKRARAMGRIAQGRDFSEGLDLGIERQSQALLSRLRSTGGHSSNTTVDDVLGAYDVAPLVARNARTLGELSSGTPRKSFAELMEQAVH